MTDYSLSSKYTHAVCGLRLGPDFGVRPVVKNNFYLRLMVEKVCAFAVLSDKYLRICGGSGTNFTAVAYCVNLEKLKKKVKSVR